MDKPISKGRGTLLAMLQKHKQEQAIGLQATGAEEKLPPKSRGRAALLQKLQEQKERKVGVESKTVPLTEPAPSPRGLPKTVERAMSEVSLVTSEPVSYKGTQGTPIAATANYIELSVEKDRGVFEYEVRFSPDIDARSYRIKLVNQALGEWATTKVYDGDACLYLPAMIFQESQEFHLTIPNTEDPVTITISYKRKQRLGECLHLYNVLFKRIMNVLLYTRMGRNYFNMDHKFIVPQHKLDIYPGYAIHVDEMEGGLMVCLDTQHRVIRSQTVYELFHDIRAANPRNFRETATKMIIGSVVLTKYNNKSYTIDDIGWGMKPTDTFDTRAGGKCSFLEYYKVQHNIRISDVEQPLLISRQSRTINNEKVEHMICLVPELSYLTGLTDAMRADFKVMKDVAVHTRITPNQRMLAIRSYVEKVQNSELAQKILGGWGLRIVGGSSSIKARVLPNEMIYFGRNETDSCKGGGDWNRAIADNSLTGPIDILNWQLYFTNRDRNNARTFAETMTRLAKGIGCNIRQPQLIELESDRSEAYMAAITQNVTRSIQVGVFICPTIRADRYSVIKKMLCTQIPIASQVILSKTLMNQQKVRSIVHKIAMQIICKLGGTLWSVKIPCQGWMVCGMDVYHGLNQKSVCGFVSSLNDSMTRYYSEAIFQEREIGDSLKRAFRNGLLQRQERLARWPVKIIMFRDGVGDGQLAHCQQYEVRQFEEVLRELNIESELIFVVVQKRINTRVFRELEGGNYDNPPSGTVVDSAITRKKYHDFYLVPQSVRQGTVNPTHYIVLQGADKILPDHLQRLTYKLCHLYYNWCGTIRVPAPCLYAHKLAAIVGQHIKKTPDVELSDKLYFL